MFFDKQKYTEALAESLQEFRAYGDLRLESFLVSLTTKLTRILSAIIIGLAIFVLVGVIVLFASAMAIFALAPYIGGVAVGCGAMVVIYTAIAIWLFNSRKRLVYDPIANLLANILLSDINNKKS